ncbi:MAG: OmpA family protein [Actinomycetota bacterium]
MNSPTRPPSAPRPPQGFARWRLPLAAVLVVANVGLVVANLSKFDLPPFASDGDGEEVAVDDGSTTSVTGSSDPSVTTVAEEEVASPDTSVEAPVEDVDDWPGGRGPVPEGPPEGRRVLIAPDGSARVIGSAPTWATATQMVNVLAANLGTDPASIDNQLTWHPDAIADSESGLVVIEQAATFSLGASTIDPGSLPTLNLVANLLNSRQTLFVVVIGHTDDVGDEQLNAELASERAQAVVDYLVSQGVVAGQLVVASAGEDAPIQSNETAEGRSSNRRIELQLKNFLVDPSTIG